MIYLLLNKRKFHPHSGPRFTHAVALAQNQLSYSLVQTCCQSYNICWITQVQYHQLIGSQIGRVQKKQFSVQCTGDPKTVATNSWLENKNYSNRHTAWVFSVCISCSALAHHQFYFIQTQFVNVSSLTIITAQVFHRYSLIHIKHRILLWSNSPDKPLWPESSSEKKYTD